MATGKNNNEKVGIIINTKKVGSFLKGINDAERIYLGHTLNLSNSIQRLIQKFDLTKKDICMYYGIRPSKYKDFVSGNFNYDLRAMSLTNSLFIKLESEALEEKAPVQIPYQQERRERKKREQKGKDKLNTNEEVEKK